MQSFFRRFALALAALGLFLALAGSAVDAALVKRDVPAFISSWNIYQRYMQWYDQIADFDVPGLQGVKTGVFDDDEQTLKWECYTVKIGAQLAKGEAIVYKAVLSTPGQPDKDVVAKMASMSTAKAQVLYGASLQTSVDNSNVLPITDYVLATPTVKKRTSGWAIMPYVAAGSLETNFGSYKDQGTINTAFKQILSAVSAVSAAGILHRDLKPENFLVDTDGLKLMDFDQSRGDSTSDQCDVGTSSYQAPEILLMNFDGAAAYDTKVDVFPIGMTFLVLSVPELQVIDNRFALWKELISPVSAESNWNSADQIAGILRGHNYPVFQNNDNLLNVIAKALCRPSERYTPSDFESAFGGAV